MPYTFSVCKKSEMPERVRKLKITGEPFKSKKFEGFSYFSPDHVYGSRFGKEQLPEDHFFLAYYRNKIVGVCLLQKSPYEPEAWWISYIDVHQKHRRKGIAKGLYRVINEWVNPNDVIYGSRLSDDGERANLYVLRKQIITRCKCFATREEYYEAKSNEVKI